MLKLKDILERRATVETELRGLYDVAVAANQDLEGEKLEKWTSFKSELDDLKGKEARARQRDELDRHEEGRNVEQRGDADGEAVFGLLPEQRMADHLKATTGEDASGLSVGRAVRGMLTNNWEGAEAERRVMGTTPGAAGGFLMPSPISANVIDLARNATVLIAAGALTIPMASKNLRVVKIVTDPTAAWRAEGATISESDATFEGLNLTAHSLAALVRVNAELMDDVPSFAATLDAQLAAALGLELDRVGMYGNGAGQPLGLRYTDNVNEQKLGTNDGATPGDYDKFLDLIADIEADNGAPDTVVYAPRTKNTLAKIKTGITSDLTKLTPPADFAALTKRVSNQISITETQGSNTDASTAFMGGFSNMAFAIRQNVTIEASRVSGTAFEKNQVLVRAILRADVAVYRPNQFGRLIGIRG